MGNPFCTRSGRGAQNDEGGRVLISMRVTGNCYSSNTGPVFVPGDITTGNWGHLDSQIR